MKRRQESQEYTKQYRYVEIRKRKVEEHEAKEHMLEEEAASRKAKEEEAATLEFDRWKGELSVDAEGTTENEVQEGTQGLLYDFVEYIKVPQAASKKTASEIPTPEYLIVEPMNEIIMPLLINRRLIYAQGELLNVYAPRYESAGKFWPVVHDSTIFSLVLMQFIAFGIFTLKKLPHATTATLPLPIITLLFNEYCRKRFLPIFMAYSTETLLKKDKEDRYYPDMPQFLAQISAAYQDPALAPMVYSASSDDLREPLIPTAQVRG